MSKILVDRELLDQLAGMELDTTERSIKIQDELRAILAHPAEAEGVEVIAYATPNEDGDWQMLFFDEKEAIQYVDDEPPAPLVLQSAHIAALSAVTAERDRLREALSFACKALCQVTSSDGSGHADIALSVLRLAGVGADEREALVEGWKANVKWRADAAMAAKEA